MAFSLDGMIVDRIQMGIAEDFSGNLLYTLTQLSEATIETTAESKDAVDKDGTLIKRFWQSKAATLSATNAMLDFNILGEQSGSGKQIAASEDKIQMPKIDIVKQGTTTVDLAVGVIKDTIKVSAMANNGTLGKSYTLGASASATEFVVSSDGSKLTLPTDATADKFVVKYERKVESGARVVSNADEFPRTIKLTLKALVVDPCSADTLRAAYIIMPSFQVSAETSVQLTTDATFEFTGDCQVNYCADEKQLFEIVLAEEDTED